MKIIAHEKNRLDTFLTAQIDSVSRNQIRLLIKDGSITVNGKVVTVPHKMLHVGDTIFCDDSVFNDSPFPEVDVDHLTLDVIYEDDDFAVINKPPFLTVHPVHVRDTSPTLVHCLRKRFSTLSDLAGPLKPGIVHRLDNETSGLMLIAKNNEWHAQIKQLFMDRAVEKKYIALVHGTVADEEGMIEGDIARNPHNRLKMALVADGMGKSAKTYFTVSEYLKNYTLLDISLITGRTHQIRVHFSALNHPLAGDRLYASSRLLEQAHTDGFSRLFLHCNRLSFTLNKKAHDFSVPLASDLDAMIHRYRH